MANATEPADPPAVRGRRVHVQLLIPDDLHRRVKARAAMAGRSIVGHVLNLIEEDVGADDRNAVSADGGRGTP